MVSQYRSNFALFNILNVKNMSKVSVIGAGNVGATCANVLAHQDIVNEIVMIDIAGDLAKGKALDMW